VVYAAGEDVGVVGMLRRRFLESDHVELTIYKGCRFEIISIVHVVQSFVLVACQVVLHLHRVGACL